ncbi:MAG: HAD family phosphatase [Gemmatimonadetes bacterium]|nr:HAD family phosphatase [Gemmatimonadota bacterium]
MTDALLFDFNGVIVDDEPLHFAALRYVLAEEGLPLDRETYDAHYLGFDDRANLRTAYRRAGRVLERRAAQRLLARKAERYAALAARELRLVPGVSPFVRAAASRAAVAVVSGALRSEIVLGLERAGLADVVAAAVCAEDAGVTKPDPTGYRLALARLAGPTAGSWRAAVIEDSLPGLQAARAFGAGCAMLTTSHSADRLRGADLVWNSFEGHRPEELDALLRPVEVWRDV